MNQNNLLNAASFSPRSLQSPNAWVGHLPFAAWVIQEVSPKIFVELGTHSGNSFFSFCQSVVEAGISTKCYAVDIWQGDEHAGQYNEEIFAEVNAHHQEHYAGFSRLLRMTFDDAVTYFADESIDLLHIDGLHTYEAVRHDFETWLPKLAPGAVVMFHDTNVRERNFGVWKLWEELQARYPNNLEFVHSHGLGVVQLNNAPDNKRLEWLQSSSPVKQRLLNYFAALGSRQLERFELNELKQRAFSLTQAVAEHDGQIVNLNQAVATASTMSHPRFKASIIIPVFNKLDLTRQCLTTLASLTTMPEYEVIVVDNASTDGTAEFLAELGGDVQVIRNPDNYGFAVASNQGAKAARGEFLLFLNNDTIPTDGWLNALVDEVECHPEVAVVGSKLLYEDGTIQHAGVAFSRIVFTPYHIYRKFPADSPMVNRRREFQCVTAACMLVRRDVFEQVGRFDEGFKNGFEDVDLCLKIRDQGWHIMYRPDSVVYHLESQTAGRKSHDTDNARRLLERWSHKWWIPDEDALYLSDGLACQVRTEQGMLYNQLESLTSVADRTSWQLVADTQFAAQRQDFVRVKALLNAVDQWPNDVWVLRWGALVCKCIDVPALAISFWKRVVAIEPDADGYQVLAKAALEVGQLDEAERRLAELHSFSPKHGGGWLLSGIVSMQRHRFAEAKPAFERAATYGADRRKAKLGIGMAAMGLAESADAWELFLDVATEHPDDAETLHWLLRAGTALQRWEPLEPVLSQYVSRNPGDLSLRFALAGVFLRLNRCTAARHEYDSIRLLDPVFDGLSELASAINEQESALTHHHAAR